MDSAFFSDEMVETLDGLGTEFTIPVPFERFAQLKRQVQERRVWWPATADGKLRFFQKEWKPKCWSRKFRFLLSGEKLPSNGTARFNWTCSSRKSWDTSLKWW